MAATSGIGTLKEGSLHAEIKDWYRNADDLVEVKLGNHYIDIVRGDLLIEIQTGSLYKIREKITKLLPDHRVRIVYPIAQNRWITRVDFENNILIRRRKSPKKNKIFALFDQLIYLTPQILNPNCTLEILMIEQEDTWINDGRGSWRRKYWSIADRHLLAVYDRTVFNALEDYRALIPADISGLFSSRELANQIGIPRKLAGKMLYCLNALELVGVRKVVSRRRYYSLVEK